MTLPEINWQVAMNVVLGVLGTAGGAGGIWSWLRVREAAKAKLLSERQTAETHRDDNELIREAAAVAALNARVESMEREVKTLTHDAHVYRRVSHDMADIANAARLVLITKFIEVNEILVECGKTEKYPDPVAAAMAEVDKISKSIVGERQALYDKAEYAEGQAEIQKTAADVKKENIVQSGGAIQ